MSYLFFDTETTGFPPGAPHVHLVQLAWVLFDDQGKECGNMNLTVKPDGWTIPAAAAKIHGISTALANTYGVPIRFPLSIFQSVVYLADCVVGHNLDYDKGIMAAEFQRVGWDNPLAEKSMLCTMKTSAVINHCQISRRDGGLKWPKLAELHTKLFDADFENAHDALADVRATARCFWELRRLGLI